MSRARKWPLVAAVAVVLALGSWLARPDLIESDAPVTQLEATPELIAKGEYLARAGNCIGCHTVPGREPYSGGRRIPTPFGDVFTSNLTPDPETGIGEWSSADFWRAMHYGKSRDGRRLYPAFPYPSYTRVTREDSDAIFAYLGALPPVASPRPAHEVRFPYNTALAQIVWRALYFTPGEQEPDPERSAEWNRGAYLVEGLGHCGACHTARTALGGENRRASYAGGAIPMLGWDAPALAPVRPMTTDDAREMAELLKTGTSRRGVATGPMAEVVFHSLQYLEDADIAAMVAYVASLPNVAPRGERLGPAVGPAQAERLTTLGATVYREHCAECHGQAGEGEPYTYPALAGNSLVAAPSARNALQTVLSGGYGPSTRDYPYPYGMPPFAHRLSREETAAVVTFVRRAWGNGAGPLAPEAVRQQ